MTRLRKKKTHEYLLVLTVLILVQPCWTFDGHEPRKLSIFSSDTDKEDNCVEVVVGTTADANTLQYYLSRWKDTGDDNSTDNDVTYYGEGLPEVFFHSSATNESLTLVDLSRCMSDFQFVTCLKLLLVNRLDNLLDYLNGNNLTNTDFSFGNGIVSFKSVPGVNGYEGRTSGAVGLDEDITRKMMELFRDRSLKVNLLPGVGLDVKPVPGKSPEEFIGFRARPYLKWQFWRNDDDPEKSEGRSGNKKKKKGGFQMPSMMILPQLIMWGFMPFALANLQAMVMNAFMLNMMALNSAIFMTIRNLVFGPRGGPKIKYVNYGYRKKKKSSVPTIIVHSPAAFVKQPFHLIHRNKKPIHHGPHPPPEFYDDHHHHHPPPEFHDHHHHQPPPEFHDHHHHQPPPEFHDHHHHQPPPEFHDQILYHDDPPPTFSEGIQSSEPEITNHGEPYDDFPPYPPHRNRDRRVEVFGEEGQLDGKNRVRIRIPEKAGPSVKEILHRIRTIEHLGKRFNPGYDYQEVSNTGYSEAVPSGFPSSSADNTPWTISEQSASRLF